MRNYIYLVLLLSVWLSCNPKHENSDINKEFLFVKVDSLVIDILDPVKIVDYHPGKEIYLAVKFPSMEGHYYILDKEGKILAENELSEGPDAFGLVLIRGGFVGDEILMVSEGHSYVYDLNLKQLRKYPFQQGVRFRLVHYNRDNLSTFQSSDGTIKALVNINDGYLQPYPEDYYDTLNLVHLMDIQSGNISKGGTFDESSMFRSGRFFPFMDKPVYFSDPQSSYISMIAFGDSILYQIDPKEDFKTVNKIFMERIGSDKMIDIPMSDASYATVREHRGENFKMGGMFDGIVGQGDELLVAYRTGINPNLKYEGEDESLRQIEEESRKRYYYYIKDGKRVGKPILWDNPGSLLINVGNNRYLQYGDQGDLHEYEKDYQCYYIYELSEKQ
ncbi:hypothetical protein ACFOUP_14205 [Belliella kenyensis]|uniref:6-bladed beta-propeller n=1 Tax=Belliella kenyensis TaxID=1472724 RepID=A0ABV8ENQ5_9BACT|nr:hypothetical protein [Belliella kenyensis]MCH7401597.1 hypothetical protein [Belliella kenyensis]MDN3603123.1 hypothetical protein [Belliella kenyensis]